ncbi:MAG: hypothetical protein QW331_01925 [Candidatus Woesearchaeota archaeon]
MVEDIIKAILSPISILGQKFLEHIPNLIAAAVVLIIGYIISLFIGLVVRQLLERTKLDKVLVFHTKIFKAFGDFQLSHLAGLLVKWWVFVLFLPPAAELIKLNTLAQLLISLALWIPNLIAAVLIGLVGLVGAEYVNQKIISSKVRSAAAVGSTAKVLIVVFTLLISLQQIGISIDLAQNSFLIILSGIVFAVALAIGIGFGLGLKDEAKSIIKNVRKKL